MQLLACTCVWDHGSWIFRRFGFLEDPYPGSDLTPDQPHPGSSPLSFGVYIHYTGCAMVRPITSSLAFREREVGTLSHDSPPLPEEDGNIDSHCHKDPVCGFHWFWNHCYLQQRTSQATPAEKHEELLEDFRSYCSSDCVILPFACSQLLEQTETPPTVTRPHPQYNILW